MPRYQAGADPFHAELRRRADAWFAANRKNRRGGAEAVLTTAAVLVLYAASWAAMLANRWGAVATLGFALLFGTTNVLVVFWVGHAAAHNALFRGAKLNRLFAYALSLIGTTPYLWDLTHNRIHHAVPNVAGWDTDIEQQAPLIRVSPTVPLRWYHRFQPGYATAVYATITLFLVFIKDFQDLDWLPGKDSQALKGRVHPRREHLALAAAKVVHFSLTLVIPFAVLEVSVAQFAFGFFLVHAWMSLILAVVLIPAHLLERSARVVPTPDGRIEQHWARHVLDTTADYAPRSRLVTWLTGGLNLHVVHHLFPGVFHGHYRALAPLVTEVARAHGLTHRQGSLAAAIASHYRLLHELSRPEAPGSADQRLPAQPLVT